ncbi:MAG: hypothetical protein Kow0099_12910 [Candidatus Abyssubacteria bacterium]
MKNLKRIALFFLILPIPVVAVALSSRSSERNHRLEDITYALGSEDPHVRMGAVVTLPEYGESAVPILKDALDDPDPGVRRAAIHSLGKIGGAAAAEALATLLSDPDRNVRIMAILSLGETGRDAMPHLLKALESEPFPRGRMFAATAITHLAQPGDTADIMKRFERQDSATRMHLVIALVKIDDDEAYRALKQLAEHPDRLVRFYVVNTIAEAPPDKRSLPILLDSLDDTAQEVRMWAMFGLEHLNHPKSYEHVLSALGDEDAYVRKEAAYTLGNLGNPAAVPYLIACLNDPHYLVRCDSAESLGKLGDTRAIVALRPMLEEQNAAIRIKTAEALARLNDYSGMETLIELTGDPNLLYQMEACRSLQALSSQDIECNQEAWQNWWLSAKESVQTEPVDSQTR